MVLLEIFLSFFKIGMFSFGGGYAMISLLQNEAVSKSWLTVSQFSDIVAISQITPGPIAVNMATYVGFMQAGVWGSLLATLGVSLPSFIIILSAIRFINKFNSSKLLNHVFDGLRPAVCGLVAAAAVQIALPELYNGYELQYKSIIIFGAAFFIMYKLKQNPIFVILGAAIVGIIVF